MKKILTAVIFCSVTGSSFAQNGWFQLSSSVSVSLTSVFFTDVNTGYAVGSGAGTILKTTNGGVNWINISIGGSGFNSVYFIQNTGYAVGNGGTIYKTINAGLSWVGQTSGTIYNLRSVFFVDAYTGYTAGHDIDPPNSVIKKTTNGGTTWTTVSFPGGSFGLRTVYFLNANTGFAAGAFGVIIKTTNGGSKWSNQNLPSNQNVITSFSFANFNTGYLSGGDPFTGGFIYKTTNSGLNWVSQLTGLSNTYLFSISLPSGTGSDTAFISGDNGKILRTTNGGSSWDTQISGTTNLLSSIIFTSAGTGYTVGYNGTILKTITGGVTSIHSTSNNIPDKFSLSQNYPNPFNPSTKINYELPITNYVSIKVYDALGNEVETLVNEKQNAGSYSVDFNAASLPSGIYFYKLVTEKFSETKKMILIK